MVARVGRRVGSGWLASGAEREKSVCFLGRRERECVCASRTGYRLACGCILRTWSWLLQKVHIVCSCRAVCGLYMSTFASCSS